MHGKILNTSNIFPCKTISFSYPHMRWLAVVPANRGKTTFHVVCTTYEVPVERSSKIVLEYSTLSHLPGTYSLIRLALILYLKAFRGKNRLNNIRLRIFKIFWLFRQLSYFQFQQFFSLCFIGHLHSTAYQDNISHSTGFPIYKTSKIVYGVNKVIVFFFVVGRRHQINVDGM
ncbi:hypothetical protein ROZALSC1DRAFT_22927 [Rozella allomycis CSF55]|uniref:Uncharacterized protein n=1 Tax=Rozella allomycis (strain CSF55) TaxID=988480 RepID=A0A4P9YH97_ROZAC|nr:hypothetical protein ROZALSC1DRAFT_22927 [Rozella allomycis CSF55]